MIYFVILDYGDIKKKKKKKVTKRVTLLLVTVYATKKRTFGDKSLSPKIHFAIVYTSIGLSNSISLSLSLSLSLYIYIYKL